MISAILNSAMLESDTAILDLDTLLSSLRFTQKHSSSTLTLTQTNSIWLTEWWQPSSILPSWIQPFCTKLWLKLVQSDSNSFILTQLDEGSHLELCHHGFSHFAQKKLHSFILTQLNDCSYVEICHPRFSHFVQKELQSFIISQLDDGSHLEFCHYGFSYFAQKKNFTHSFWLNFMMAAILNSANMDSAILHKTLTQTSSIWLKLIHCHSTWWWQPFWILPSWFQTLPSWIQTPCYLISDSLKNTLPQLWPWLKLIQSD